MYTQQFSSILRGAVAELDWDFSQIFGTGVPEFPTLTWQTRLHLRPVGDVRNDYVLRSLEAQLMLPDHQKVSIAAPQRLTRILRSHETQTWSEYVNLEFSLDITRIEMFERCRAGGAMRLRMNVQLDVDEHGLLEDAPGSGRAAQFGLRAQHRLHIEQDLEIPQSVWIGQFLPRVGYGTVHIIELPAVPVSACQLFSHSFEALKQAQELHKIGLYDDAVAKCRVALEPFYERGEVQDADGKTRPIPILKKCWEGRLGKATYDWLAASLGALKDVSNKPHHSPNLHFDQLESQMLLSIMTALVAYAARAGVVGSER